MCQKVFHVAIFAIAQHYIDLRALESHLVRHGFQHMQNQNRKSASFSEEQMLEELRGIILIQGDYLWLTSGRLAAEKFVGFEIPEDEDCLSLMSSAKYKMDMDDFLISQSFADAHTFAFQSRRKTSLEDGILPRLRAFIANIPRTRIYPLLAEQPVHSRVPRKLCQTTVDVASARWKLEVETQGDFTFRELGLLANVSLQKVVTDFGNGHLSAIMPSRPTTVVFDEARRWLLAQHTFQSAASAAT